MCSEIPAPSERLAKQHARVEAGAAGIDTPASVNGHATSPNVFPLILGLIAVAECGVAAAEIGIALAERAVRETIGVSIGAQP